MKINLPKKTLIMGAVALILLLVVIAVVLLRPSKEQVITEPAVVSTNDAYFIPPKQTSREVKLTGRVEPIARKEGSLATHKIVDVNTDKTIAHAYTSDDKLRQQEGNVVSLVGEMPITSELGSNTVVFIKYITFK